MKSCSVCSKISICVYTLELTCVLCFHSGCFLYSMDFCGQICEEEYFKSEKRKGNTVIKGIYEIDFDTGDDDSYLIN